MQGEVLREVEIVDTVEVDYIWQVLVTWEISRTIVLISRGPLNIGTHPSLHWQFLNVYSLLQNKIRLNIQGSSRYTIYLRQFLGLKRNTFESCKVKRWWFTKLHK